VDIRAYPLDDKDQTGHAMYETVKQCFSDLGEKARWHFEVFFDYVRRMPYLPDDAVFSGRVIEFLSRPRYSMPGLLGPIDCKKKAILIGSWAHANGYPYRFLAISERGDKEIHHVAPQIDFGKGWVNADATLHDYSIGMPWENATYVEELQR